MKTCLIEGCEKKHFGKGLCQMHHKRYWRHGDPSVRYAAGNSKWSHEEFKLHFWAKVDRSGGPEGCWPWLGVRNASGHGRVNRERGSPLYTHRVAYELSSGVRLAKGDLVCHRCDNPPCCNPAHLFVGTAADNIHDMVAKGRAWFQNRT